MSSKFNQLSAIEHVMGISLDSMTGDVILGALALGNFDGVHMGHRAVLEAAVEASADVEGDAAAITFAPHPREYFAPEAYSKVYDLDQNIRLMKSFGMRQVFVQKFDHDFSELSAEDFLDFLYQKLKFKNLVTGFDFRFGKNRDGDDEVISNWCKKKNIGFKLVPCFAKNDLKVSTTLIKKKLDLGDVAGVSEILGHTYFHEGVVVQDQGLGKSIGFPTINLKLDSKTKILCGVYKTQIWIKNQAYSSISNIGFRPSVAESLDRMVLETHVLEEGFDENTKGEFVKVEFHKFIRPEQKFSSVSDLQEQIQIDVKAAKAL